MAAKTLSGDVFFASIGELSAGLRAKEYSAVELTRAFCDRLEKIGAAHNALALSLRHSALKKAKDVDGVQSAVSVRDIFGSLADKTVAPVLWLRLF